MDNQFREIATDAAEIEAALAEETPEMQALVSRVQESLHLGEDPMNVLPWDLFTTYFNGTSIAASEEGEILCNQQLIVVAVPDGVDFNYVLERVRGFLFAVVVFVEEDGSLGWLQVATPNAFS